MRKPWVIWGLLLGAIFFLSACQKELSLMNKYAKKGDIEQRDSAAMYFYENGNYEKAAFLFEELRSLRRGDKRGEDYLYYYAYCKYKQGLFVSAGYYFEQFTQQYPTSERIEESAYMVAYCNYQQSDPYYLDQSFTQKALDQMQIFINLYPGSLRVEEANKIMAELREKLAKKDYESAKLYLKLDNFKAGVEAFEVFIRQYPDSRYREEAQYLLFKTSFLLAEASTDRKKQNRYLDAIEYYQRFVDRFPNSVFLRDAENLYIRANKGLEKVAGSDS